MSEPQNNQSGPKNKQPKKPPLVLSWRQDFLRQLRVWTGGWFLARTANIAMLAVAAIFVFICWRSLQFLTSGEGTVLGNVWSRLGEMLTSARWDPEGTNPRYGMIAMLYGSLLVTVGAMIIAIPLSLATAVFLSDMVPFRVRQIIKPVMELLAAIPSVAFGFFAIKVVAPWLQTTFGFPSGANALNASLILAIMAVPTITSVAEDALVNLGRELREASYALGATRFETMIRVVIPAAHNGIITAVVLGMMRAIGETMVVWMAAGNASNVPVPWYDVTAVIGSFGDAVRTMTATIAGDMGETPAGSLHRSALFAVGLVLLVFTFALNLVTESLSKHLKGNTESAEYDATKRRGWLRQAAWNLRVTINRIIKIVRWPLFRLLQMFSEWNGRLIRFIGEKRHLRVRLSLNHGFTGLCVVSVGSLVAVLFLVLGPLLANGTEAFLFRGTVEHRLFLREQFARGDADRLQTEWEACQTARKPVYDLLERYIWLAPEPYMTLVSKLDRQTRSQNEVRLNEIRLLIETYSDHPSEHETEIAKLEAEQERLDEIDKISRRIARYFKNLCETEDIGQLESEYAKITEIANETDLSGFPIAEAVGMAKKYFEAARNAELSLRTTPTPVDPNLTYSAAYLQIRNIITGADGNGALLGPQNREGNDHLPPEIRYGASHWSMAKRFAAGLKETTVWKPCFDDKGNVLPSVGQKIARRMIFENTSLAGINEIFEIIDRDLVAMMMPRWTFYAGYFFDPPTAGHFLGGVGHELLGTLLITLCSIFIAFPIGVATAAYLVEVSGDGWVTRTLRLCISTLAGVPSIVFGLFGLAVIVEYLTGKPCILAGSITLALLVLPVIIRASEEAIRSVPQTYREASLGLGAGRARCFFTVTLPAAMPGVLTGTILAMSRAAGETAPLLFTCAVATGSLSFGKNILMQPTPILSYAAYDIAVGDRIAELVPHNQFGIVTVLIMVVLALNVTAIVIRGRIAAKLRGM
ncbi:MAG: phosphate ABC transporter permease subunit PstC [Planctomycetaceae bacterium]|nr:phosphate ABC transporter permease subunit PstC [Planctomycetaceae bacterium]